MAFSVLSAIYPVQVSVIFSLSLLAQFSSLCMSFMTGHRSIERKKNKQTKKDKQKKKRKKETFKMNKDKAERTKGSL
jgi:hypothetical protein